MVNIASKICQMECFNPKGNANRNRMTTLAARTIAMLAVCFCILAHTVPAWANGLEMQSDDERNIRWDLTADSLVSFNDSEILEATGNVLLTRGDEFLKADFARYYLGSKWVYLSGNVQVRMGRDIINAEEAEFDLGNRVGWMKRGRVFVEGPHAYISGETIRKYYGDVYSFQQAQITTCDGDNPAWSMRADEVTLEIDGYAHMKDSQLLVKGTPVMYMPYFLYPAKTTRQTGLLLPEYGHSSTRGFFYNQPFFWAIDESSDILLNAGYMTKRGPTAGIQYRTRPDFNTTGWIRFDWMHDRKTVHSVDGGPFSGDDHIRTNHQRGWLRGMFDSKLEDSGWRFKGDLDFVSDQDYLSEIDSSIGGFDRTRDDLFELFRRDIAEKDRHRKSGLLLTKQWERGSLNLGMFYSQDPALGNGNRTWANDTTVQRLPQVDAYLHKGRIFPEFPLEVDLSTQGTYMFRQEGTKGARYMISPNLTLPLTSPYGSLIVRGGMHQLLYGTEDGSRSPGQNKDENTIPLFSAEAFTEFARVYDLETSPIALAKENAGQSRWVGLRHSIQPRVEYRFLRNLRQYDTPQYDAEDVLASQSELVYSITNVLTRKRESVVMVKGKNKEFEPQYRTTYLDLVRFRVEQAYDYREAGRSRYRDQYERRPMGDIKTELSVGIDEYVSATTRNDVSFYTGEIVRHESGLNFSFPDYGSFYLGYDYRKARDEYNKQRYENNISYIMAGINLTYFDPIHIRASLAHDFTSKGNQEVRVDTTYNHQCYSFGAGVTITPREESYGLHFAFTGLGD